MATIDPGNAGLLRTQTAFFDNMRRLPLTKFYYGMSRTGLAPTEVAGDDPELRPQVLEHVQLRRAMVRPVSTEVAMTFVRREGRWLLGAEVLEKSTVPRARPWYGVPVDVATRGDLVVLTDRGAQVGARELLDRTRTALEEVTDVLDLPGAQPLLVDATSNGLPAKVNQSDEDAGAYSIGLYATSRDGKQDRGKAGELIRANPDDVTQLVEGPTTLRHELTHFVLDGFGDTNPQWVTEGIAQYVGLYPGLLARARVTDPTLRARLADRPVELTAPGLWGSDPFLDYLTAEAFAEHLVTRFGTAKYLEMMRLFRRIAVQRNLLLGQGVVDEVLERVYGVSAESVARAGFDLVEQLSGPA
ncbi:hypothetical protein [Nocardioides rubriscoriae]|uniref:hypothetical protein n=1 Tax=Nocardioides rubriscoriae TaxID=642762 RepID=UPI0011E003AD|nr:hypothetical protein [Nocardioides rubriscoriae]